MDLLKVTRFPYQKRLHKKVHFNLATEVRKYFSPGVSNRLCLTHSKNSNDGNLELKNELIIFLFLKLTPKATARNVNSNC